MGLPSVQALLGCDGLWSEDYGYASQCAHAPPRSPRKSAVPRSRLVYGVDMMLVAESAGGLPCLFCMQEMAGGRGVVNFSVAKEYKHKMEALPS